MRAKIALWRCAIALLLISILRLPLAAQTAQPASPNYVLSIIYGQITPDGTQVEVQFGVTNIGSTSTLTTRAELLTFDDNGEGEVVASADLRPLAGNNDREIITLRTDLAPLPPGSVQVFRVQIASLPGQAAITSDTKTISIDIPLNRPATPRGFDLRNLGGVIDLNDRQQVLLLVGIISTGLLLVLLFIRLLRLLFGRTPNFRTVWQPPYATVPPLDAHSTAGIRQSWQPLAQNNLVTSAPNPGAFHVRKLLLGSNGLYLSGWQLVALRLIQYDQYGRVSRSETLANGRMIREFNRLTGRSGTLLAERLLRRVRGNARRLTGQFFKKVSPRSAMLPIALDVRFKGVHGEVSILFELYRSDNGYWHVVDGWQPEMMIAGRTLQESYTYSLYGQNGGETMRQFRRRLPEDVARMLIAMIGPKPPAQPSVTVVSSSPATNPAAPKVEEGDSPTAS